MDRRTEILEGTISFPEQIMKLVNPDNNLQLQLIIMEFWNNLTHNFLREKSCDTLAYRVLFNEDTFNLLLRHLSKAGWITSEFDGKYAWIDFNESKLFKWITKEELIEVKRKFKFMKYRLKKTKSYLYDQVQINNTYKETGLKRRGFMKAGNTVFRYDTLYLSKYRDYIAKNVMKGLSASTKDITYQEVISELLHYYSEKDNEYTMGNCLIDSRGRSIFNCSKKIFNPVSCKDARALLIGEPRELTKDGYDAIYAFIAELLGYRGKNIDDKIEYGENCYEAQILPSLEEMELKSNYDDLYKRIWLERIYENLDIYPEFNEWFVPIEVDAQASMLQFIGVLTNDYQYMLGTNMIPGEPFRDIWTRSYVSRTHVKKYITPQLYGSSQHAKDAWDNNKLEYNQKQVNEMTKDLLIGIYSNANNFKNFIINNVKPKVDMEVNINNEIFNIKCNRYKWEEMKTQEYFIYNSKKESLVRVTREVNMVYDTNQFKRYFVTLLLHNLDSQVANKICSKINWILSNHDSWTIHPNDVAYVRDIYTLYMENIYNNRKKILKDYFLSIGITEEFKEQEHDNKIKFFSPYCVR